MKNKKLNKIVQITCTVCGTKYTINEWMITDEYNGAFCPNSITHYQLERQKLADKIPVAKKQKYIDLLHSGKTIGEGMKELDLTMDEAVGIINENLKTVTFLSREAKNDELKQG